LNHNKADSGIPLDSVRSEIALILEKAKMVDAESEVLKYLADTKAFFLAYHNQKETMAWAGVVLFLALLTALLNTADKVIPKHKARLTYADSPTARRRRGRIFLTPNTKKSIGYNIFSKWAITLIIVIFSATTAFYITYQYRLRSYAAAMNEACQRESEEILRGKELDLSKLFAMQREPHVLPNLLADKVREVENRTDINIVVLNSASYIIVLGSAIATIILIWLRY
jgi:hypothetical protein